MLTPEQQKIAALQGQVDALRERLYKLCRPMEDIVKRLDKFETDFARSDLTAFNAFLRNRLDIFPDIDRNEKTPSEREREGG